MLERHLEIPELGLTGDARLKAPPGSLSTSTDFGTSASGGLTNVKSTAYSYPKVMLAGIDL